MTVVKRLDGASGCYAVKHNLPPVKDRPNPDTVASLERWILHLPGHHAAWDFYALLCCSLADFPGVPPAKKHFPGATHEFVVGAINPDFPRSNLDAGGVDLLEPLNYVEQLALPNDAAASRILEAVAADFVNGNLPAEPQGILGARSFFRARLQKLKDEVCA